MRISAVLAGFGSMVLLAGVVALPMAAASASQPTTLYVNSAVPCSDSGSGTHALPFCTVQAAANVVDPGQTVDVESGESAQPVTLTRSGTSSAPITFTWTSGSPDIELRSGTGAAFTLKGVHDVTLDHFMAWYWGTATGIAVVGSRDITVDRASLVQEPPGGGTGISVDGGSSAITIAQSSVDAEHGDGIHVAAGAAQVTITTDLIGDIGGTAVSLTGAIGAALTSSTLDSVCANTADISGVTSAVVENNIFNTEGDGCAAPTADLMTAASSAGSVTADYNGLYAQAGDTEYSWAGTAYATAAAFHAATAEGGHDLDLSSYSAQALPEGSPLINSADCFAPGELSTDIEGNPRVDDPLVPDTGNGNCHADRGAVQRLDPIDPRFKTSPDILEGVAPFTASLTITSSATSPWHEAVSFTVDFGDGSAPVPVAAGATVTHTYQKAGTIPLTVTASDTGGSVVTEGDDADVGTPASPAVSFTARPAVARGAIVPDTASFTVSSPDAWELDKGIIDFGDGTRASGRTLTWTHVYTRPGRYAVTLAELDLFGRIVDKSTAITVGDEFKPASAADFSATVGGHQTVRLSAAALHAASAGVRDAFIDVTVTGAGHPGFVTVFPDGASRPSSAAVRFAAGQAASNTTLAVPGGKLVDFYNGSAGPVHLAVDTVGYDVDAIALAFVPVASPRVAAAAKIPGGGQLGFAVGGAHGVPANATAAVIDVTTTGAKAAGYLSAYGDGLTNPGFRCADWSRGQAVTCQAVVPLKDGKVVLRNGSAKPVSVLAGVVGYYSTGTGAVFLPARPPGPVLATATIGAHSTRKLKAGAWAALDLTLTTSGAAAGGYLIAWPDGMPRLGVRSLSYAKGSASVNTTTVAVGPDGYVDLYNAGAAPVTVTAQNLGVFYRYP